ncbi:chemotaxis protein CheB [Marinicella sp. W31]|uniref:chemotaxis protein CheB n=1 Tax=Marinicella sp. W31 TaxID=3023713 RepID=UPI00375642E2
MLVGLLHIGQRQKSAQFITQQLQDLGYKSKDIDWLDFIHNSDVLKPLDYVIINLGSEDADIDAALDYLSEHEIPMVFNDAYLTNSLKTDEQQRWLRHLLNKISDVNDLLPEAPKVVQLDDGPIRLKDFDIEAVWIVSAGLGGPQAIPSLLEAIGKKAAVCCIIAQEVEAEFVLMLEKQLNRQTAIQAITVANGVSLKQGQALIMPPASGFTLNSDGSVTTTELRYEGHRTFGRDLATLCEQLQTMFGMVHLAILTGMHQASKAAVEVINKHNGQVLVQSPDSCIVEPKATEVQHLKNFEFLNLSEIGQRIQATGA